MDARHDNFVYAVLSFLVGAVCFYALLPVMFSAWFTAAALLGMAALAYGLRRFLTERLVIKWLILWALIAISGFAYAQSHKLWIDRTIATPDFNGNLVALDGVVDWAEARPNGGRVLFVTPDFSVQLYTTHAAVAQLRPGCAATLAAEIKPIPTPLVKNGYDPRFIAFYDGIRGRGFLRTINALDCNGDISWAHALARLRLTIAAQFVAHLPAPQGSVTAALVTGVRGRIPADIRDLFRDSGLAHMLAISGLHMALFAGSFFAFLRLLAALSPTLVQHYNIRKISAAAALIAALAYLSISGASYATQRAFVMITLLFVAIIVGRQALTFRNLAWAALIVVLIHPHAVMRAGFQMSFIAVLALVSFYEGVWHHIINNEGTGIISRTHYIMRRLWRYVLALLATGLIAGGATGFVALYHFKQIGAYGLFANLVAMPIFGLAAMPMALPSVLLIPFGLEGYPMAVMGAAIQAIIISASYITSFDGAVVRIGASPVWVLPLAILGLSMLCLLRPRFWSRLWWLTLGILVLAMGFLGRADQPYIYVYGVGQAIAAQDERGIISVIAGKNRRFEVGVWRREHGQDDNTAPHFDCPLINAKHVRDCVLTIKDEVRLVYQPSSAKLAQYCQTMDVILTPYRRVKMPCDALVIDRDVLVRDKVVVVRKENERLIAELINSNF